MKYILLMAITLSNTFKIAAQHMPYTPHGDEWQKEISGQANLKPFLADCNCFPGYWNDCVIIIIHH